MSRRIQGAKTRLWSMAASSPLENYLASRGRVAEKGMFHFDARRRWLPAFVV